jgi:hypothetical protein
MEGFTDEQLKEAEFALDSTLGKCRKSLPRLKEGTSQHTLLVRRIDALTIAIALIRKELQSPDTRDQTPR